MSTDANSSPIKVGDRVRFPMSPTMSGRVVEFRGPLGVGGIEIYLVQLRGKPYPAYIEVRGEQIVVVPPAAKPAQTEAPAS